jgi:hypothetical protein
MSVYVNGTQVAAIGTAEKFYVNGTEITSAYVDGTQVFGSLGTWTQIFGFSLVFDNATFENSVVPQLQTTYAYAIASQSYTQGPGQDTTYTIVLKPNYRLVSSDGTFGAGVTINLYEGKSVTGVNTSHNGSTSCSLQVENFI